MLNVLDLFSGIGGFSLGLERTGGFRTVAFCEIDKKAQAVLRKHWPDVPIFDDVQEISYESIGVQVDVITGGFPCQDISLAGKGEGLAGERSGLWFEFHRLIKEIQPKYAIIENVSALRSRGLDVILSGLSEIGYDAEWHCIPASAVGAPHRRDRIWIMAHPNNSRLQRSEWGGTSNEERQSGRHFAKCSSTMAHSTGIRSSGSGQFEQSKHPAQIINGETIESFYGRVSEIWAVEPNMGRVAHGVPGRVDRLKQLGNAVVPQIPELIGRAILDFENVA